MVLAGDTDSKERSLSFAESVFKIFMRLHWNIAFNLSSQFEYNMSGTWKENKRSTPWLNFDDTSKFWGEKCMGSSRFNIYRFFFASHLQMTHEAVQIQNIKPKS